MNRVRAVFLEPFWGFLFALLPWLLLIPLLVHEPLKSELIVNSVGLKIPLNSYTNYAFSASFLTLLGFVLVRVINEFNLLIKENYLIGLVISALGSIILNFDSFSASCLATLIYTLGLYWLCKSPKEGNLNRYVFNAGFCFFLSIFFDVKFLIITPISFLLLLFLRTFSIRIVWVFLSAFVVILATLQQLNYIFNDSFIKLNDLLRVGSPLIQKLSDFQGLVLVSLFVFQLLLGFGSISKLYISLSNKLKSVSRILFYGLILLASLVVIERLSVGYFQNTIFLTASLSFIITINFMFTKNKWLLRLNASSLFISAYLFF